MGGETATRLLSDLLIRGLTVSRASKTNKLQKKIGTLPRVVFIFTFEDDLGFERHQTVPRKEVNLF